MVVIVGKKKRKKKEKEKEKGTRTLWKAPTRCCFHFTALINDFVFDYKK
jgi:hypothetical protein